jgi:hypothetical protein
MLFAFSGRATRNFLALLVVTHFIPLCRPGQPGRGRSDATGPCSPFGCRRAPYATKTTGCLGHGCAQRLNRKSKSEQRAIRGDCRCPKTVAMCFDGRTADRQT